MIHTRVGAWTQAGQPAFEVAAYLQRDGVEVVPVPVFYPDVQEILGVPVYRRLKVGDPMQPQPAAFPKLPAEERTSFKWHAAWL